MKTLAERITRPTNEDTYRIPALLLRGEAATQFCHLVKTTAQSATKLATQLLEHVMQTDPSIKKLLNEPGMLVQRKQIEVRDE